MLNSSIKFTFAGVGAFTGVTFTKIFFLFQSIGMSAGLRVVTYCAVSIITAAVFYLTANKIIQVLLTNLDKMENFIKSMTLYEIAVSSAGLIISLIIANLIVIPIHRIAIIGVPLAIFINILFAFLGVYIASGKKNDQLFYNLFQKGNSEKISLNTIEPNILDTSVIIDGRIVDICRSGFLEGELLVPDFILEELRHIADSSDILKRNRGKRGLDVLNILQKELEYPVKVENIQLENWGAADDKLLLTAKKLGGKILTTDYNLNKIANFQGIQVLNINELANALKPIALPGEEMVVLVIKDGKENGQGIGYLDDGTMIVIDGGRKHIGETLNVIVTSVLQTSAGRMIFAKPKNLIERVI